MPASPSSKAGSRSTTPISAAPARAASADAVRPARRRSSPRSRPSIAERSIRLRRQRASGDARGAERRPRRLRLTVIKGFRKQEIETLAKRDFAVGSNIVSDGLSCWTAVTAAGCSHFPMITGSGQQAAKWVPFTLRRHRRRSLRDRSRESGWVNTTLGNIKTALAGTYHHVSPKHAQRYLSSYAWRFNRRFQLGTMTERLVYACARTTPHPYRVIIAG